MRVLKFGDFVLRQASQESTNLWTRSSNSGEKTKVE